MSKLGFCPYCSERLYLKRNIANKSPEYYIDCKNKYCCGIQLVKFFGTKQEAINDYNHDNIKDKKY